MSYPINPGPDEFICPGKKGSNYPYVTTEYCECMVMNKGCSCINKCELYKRMKEIERRIGKNGN